VFIWSIARHLRASRPRFNKSDEDKNRKQKKKQKLIAIEPKDKCGAEICGWFAQARSQVSSSELHGTQALGTQTEKQQEEVACRTIPCIINAQLVCEETGFRKLAPNWEELPTVILKSRQEARRGKVQCMPTVCKKDVGERLLSP